MATYMLHFLDRDEDGNEHNGGEPAGVDAIGDASAECAERDTRGELFDGDRKVATIDADGTWRWLP